MVLIMFLIKNDIDFLTECGFVKNDINCLSLECKAVLLEQNESYFENINKAEASISKKDLEK